MSGFTNLGIAAGLGALGLGGVAVKKFVDGGSSSDKLNATAGAAGFGIMAAGCFARIGLPIAGGAILGAANLGGLADTHDHAPATKARSGSSDARAGVQ